MEYSPGNTHTDTHTHTQHVIDKKTRKTKLEIQVDTRIRQTNKPAQGLISDRL